MGAANGTLRDYPSQLGRIVELAGGSESIVQLFLRPKTLGQALVDDRSKRGGRLSKWTLDQRRSALWSFARLMAPELRRMTGRDSLEIVSEALRLVAVRVGSRYYLPGGRPRRRGGPAPTSDEVSEIVGEASQMPGFKGDRNQALLTILYESGARVNALREANCSDLIKLPNGAVRLMLHEKGRCQAREVELTAHAGKLLFDYFHRFNQEAALHGNLERIGPGEEGPLWRSGWTTRWSYEAVRTTFKKACFRAGTVDYRLHALRRAFASDAASVLPRHVVALAGGWRGTERLDDHYIQVREGSIARKLAAVSNGLTGRSLEKCRTIPYFERPVPASAL